MKNILNTMSLNAFDIFCLLYLIQDLRHRTQRKKIIGLGASRL